MRRRRRASDESNGQGSRANGPRHAVMTLDTRLPVHDARGGEHHHHRRACSPQKWAAHIERMSSPSISEKLSTRLAGCPPSTLQFARGVDGRVQVLYRIPYFLFWLVIFLALVIKNYGTSTVKPDGFAWWQNNVIL